MSYTKTQWNNDQAPAINASNLNKIEQGIFDNDAGIANLLQEIGINTNTWVSTDTYSLNDVVVYNKKLYKNITGNYTTTNPSEDTTNWNEIQIINSNGKLDKTLLNSNDILSLTRTILYDNSSGEGGDVILSDNYTNYTYLVVLVKSDYFAWGGTITPAITGALFAFDYNDPDEKRIGTKKWTLADNNKINKVSNNYYNIITGELATWDTYRIIKVIGYK